MRIGFGGGVCAPAQGDGNLIHHRRDNPKGKRGVNEYGFKDYGPNRAGVEAGFDEYRRAFNRPREAG